MFTPAENGEIVGNPVDGDARSVFLEVIINAEVVVDKFLIRLIGAGTDVDVFVAAGAAGTADARELPGHS